MSLFPPELRNVYKEGRLLPFIGAGISMSVEWETNGSKRRGPSWSELVEKAASIMGYKDIDLLRVRGSDLQILEFFKNLEVDNQTRLTNWLLRELQPSESSLRSSRVHELLSELHLCKTFYTTNFDEFLEKSFDLHSRKNKVVAKVQHMYRAEENECEIIKFHGDLNNPDMLVLSEADYEKRLTLSTELDYKFISDMLNRTILFLGYSFRDPNVSYLFRKINDQFRNVTDDPKAYIVVKYPSDFEKKLFRSRNIEILPANTDDLTDFIVNLLNFIKK